MIDFKINSDISKAESIDSVFYTDSKYLDISINKIFQKSWQLACHKSQLSDTNIYPITFLDDYISEPLVITKSNNTINIQFRN